MARLRASVVVGLGGQPAHGVPAEVDRDARRADDETAALAAGDVRREGGVGGQDGAAPDGLRSGGGVHCRGHAERHRERCSRSTERVPSSPPTTS
jgi:hypothetical protein